MTVKQAQEELATSPQLPGYGRGILHEAGRGAMIGAFGGGMYGAGAGAGILKFAPTPHMLQNPAGYLGRMTAAGALVGAVPGVLGGAIAGGIRTAQERRRLQNAAAAQQAKQAGITDYLPRFIPGVKELEKAQWLARHAANGRAYLEKVTPQMPGDVRAKTLLGQRIATHEAESERLRALGESKVLKTGLVAAAVTAGAAYGGKKLYDRYKEKQQAKQAGITDYIPGWTNLNRAHLAHIDAQYIANLNKKLNIPGVQDLVDKKRAAAIKELGIGGAKLLGTGLAVGGAAYGAKKLYNRMTDNKTQEKVSAAMQKYAENELALWGPPREGDLGSRVREMKNLNRQFQKLLIKHYDARTAAQLRDTPGMSNDIFDPNQVGSHVAEISRRQRNLVRRGLIGAQEGNKFPGGWAIQGGTRSSPQIFTRGFSSQSGMHSPIVGLPYYTAGAKPIVVPQQVTDLVHVPSSAGGAGGGALVGGGPLSLPSGGGVPTWAKALGGLALAGGAAYGGKKLYDKYKAKQQAKEAGIIDYIPGGRNLDNAYLAYGNAKRYADVAKSGTGLANALGSNYVQGLADKYRADAIGELRTGAPKLLGTGLAVGGALYGAKKLYNHMTNNKAQEKVSAYMMKYAQEESKVAATFAQTARAQLAAGMQHAGDFDYESMTEYGKKLPEHIWKAADELPRGHPQQRAAMGLVRKWMANNNGSRDPVKLWEPNDFLKSLDAQDAAREAAKALPSAPQLPAPSADLPIAFPGGGGRGGRIGGLPAARGGIPGGGIPGGGGVPTWAKVLGGTALAAGAAYGGKKLYDRYKANQQAKEAGIADYIPKFIPGVSDLRRAKTTLQGAAINRALINNIVADSPHLANYESVKGLSHLTDLDEQLGRRLTAIGGAKLLGTGLATAGAAYGGKKLYDRYKANQQAKQAAALPPSLGGEIGKHLLLAGAATLGGIAVQKGFSAASSALDKLEKPKNLARMMAVAPELRAIDPQMLSLAYDSIAAISPKLVKDPLVGASVLRKHVQTTDLSALRSAADLYRSPDPAVGSLVGSALTRAADKGYGSYEKKLETFNNPKTP